MGSLSKAMVMAGGLLLSAAPAFAIDMRTASYTCDGAAKIMAIYVGTGEDAAVVLHYQDQLAGMSVTPAASGVRYSEVPYGYVWHTKGKEAILSRETAEGETTVLDKCREMRS